VNPNRNDISSPRKFPCGLLVSSIIVLSLVGGYFLYRWITAHDGRTARVLTWIRNPSANPGWSVKAGERCDNAPFILPSDGFIGYLWGDSFRINQVHQGIDIFGGTWVNETPVIAAYEGYLTRLPDWKSSLIIRIPADPLHPDNQIWTYYTHMAGPEGDSSIAPEFPAGITEAFVSAGTLLGYQGNYSGAPGNPVGVHLHFSIVLDDGNGKFRNELEFNNTLDPSPYLGLPLNASVNFDKIPVCTK